MRTPPTIWLTTCLLSPPSSKFQVQVRLAIIWWSLATTTLSKLPPDIFVMRNTKWQDQGLIKCQSTLLLQCAAYCKEALCAPMQCTVLWYYTGHWLLRCTGGKDWITAAAILSTDHPTRWQQPPIGQICTSKIWSNLCATLAKFGQIGDNNLAKLLYRIGQICTNLTQGTTNLVINKKPKERPNFYWKLLKKCGRERQRIRDQGRNAL